MTHDYGEKTFLGETGNFDGGDIIDIIVKQRATARFISRHLYNFFVEDELQVPSVGDRGSKEPGGYRSTGRSVHEDRRADTTRPQDALQLRLVQGSEWIQEGEEPG